MRIRQHSSCRFIQKLFEKGSKVYMRDVLLYYLYDNMLVIILYYTELKVETRLVALWVTR